MYMYKYILHKYILYRFDVDFVGIEFESGVAVESTTWYTHNRESASTVTYVDL
jgi:hypothetical protein